MRAGDHVLGIRANSVELGQLLRELFADRVVDDADPPGNLSVYLASKASDGPQELHRLYVTYGRMLRTRSVRRVLDALWHELDMRDVRAAGKVPLLDATVLLREGSAHVLPVTMRRAVVDDERHWNDDGFQLVDRRWVGIDVGAGTVRVPEVGLTLTPRAEARLAAMDLDDRSAAVLSSGPVPIATWWLFRQTPSLATMVGHAGGQLLDRGRHHRAPLIGQLVTIMDRVGVVMAGSELTDVRERLRHR